MKRISIITYHRADNYGSVLQAFALSRTIAAMSREMKVQVLDYSNAGQQAIYRLRQPVRGVMDVARMAQTLVHLGALRRKRRRFEQFRRDYLPLSSYVGSDASRLPDLTAEDFAVVSGSDQIWNVRTYDYDDNYMLRFVRPGTRKVAYAPSLGLSSFTQEEEDVLRRNLADYDALSVREQAGAEVLQRVLGREVPVVLDPVYLYSVQKWRDLAGMGQASLPQGGYLLGYFIADIAGMRDFAQRMGRAMGLPVVTPVKNLHDVGRPFRRAYDAGPLEFLQLITGARAVVTDSFHAVSFSLLLHKPFWVFTEEGEAGLQKPNSRIENILGRVGLLHRRLTAATAAECDVAEEVDFAAADDVLAGLRRASLDYLGHALSVD